MFSFQYIDWFVFLTYSYIILVSLSFFDVFSFSASSYCDPKGNKCPNWKGYGKLSLGALEATSRQSKAYSRKIDGWQGSIELLHPFDAAYAISYANMMLSSPIWSFLIQFDGIWYYSVWCYLRIRMMRTMRTPKSIAHKLSFLALPFMQHPTNKLANKEPQRDHNLQWTNSWFHRMNLITSSIKSIYSTCAERLHKLLPHLSSITVKTTWTVLHIWEPKGSIPTLPKDLRFQPWSTP